MCFGRGTALCRQVRDRASELAPFGDKPVNATEPVTAICAIMRAADLNFFDLQMWYRRGQPECGLQANDRERGVKKTVTGVKR